jgi:Flp pilus assembly protein TadG
MVIPNLSKDDGQALVEFAIVLVPFAIIIFGIIELTSVYSSRLLLSYTSFMGARAAVVHLDDGAERAQKIVKIIAAGSIDPKLLIPGISNIRLKTSVEENSMFYSVRVEYRKPVSAPLVGRFIDPVGSFAGLIRVRSTTILPKMVEKGADWEAKTD